MSKAEIIRYCRRMDQKGWVANHDGNVTVRTGQGFLATPTARAKFDLAENDLLELDGEGKRSGGGDGKPFSEFTIHQRVYANRKDVHAVVHAHPPCATAAGSANQEMLTSAMPEAVVSLGPGVPLVGLNLPGSENLWAEFDALIPHYDAVCFAGNGVFSWGKTLESAFLRLELVEHLASIFLKALPLGGPQLLGAKEVQSLLSKREQAGLGLPPDPARPHWFQNAE